MTANFSRNRRRLLQLLAALAISAPLAITPRAFARTRSAASPGMAAALRQLLPNAASAAVIGRAYLDRYEEEASPRVLERSIRESLGKQSPDAGVLLQRIRRDFDTGDTVRLDGWLLSRTEARLCALRVM